MGRMLDALLRAELELGRDLTKSQEIDWIRKQDGN